ncbi:MAG: ABC transporter substrate-binding protein [Vallitalea sp.]|jgi:ABC-type transport system substrate-binding protein|nr:ABC transporter substrate-binding protein [Vallitalea sp.]
MKKILSLLLVFILAFSVTACKNNEQEGTEPDKQQVEDNKDEGKDEDQDKDEEQDEEQEQEQAEVEPSGHITIGTGNFNGEFVEGWGNNAYDNNVRKLVFGGACTGIAGLLITNKEGQIVLNSITKSREVSDDGLVHTFKLKPDLLYSDGTPLNADDVVFTYETYLDTEAMVEAGGSSSLSEYLEKVEKVDDLTVKFTIKEKFYATDSAIFTGNILSKEWAMKEKPEDKTVQQHIKDSLISKPIGYGPYKLVEYVESQYVKLTINENYIGNFEGEKTKIKDVIIKNVSKETDIDELLTGNIDILPGTVEAEKIDAVKADDNYHFSNYPRHGYGHLTFHTDFGPVRHKEVRKAISYTIDRVIFREAFLGKYSMSTDGPYSTNYWMIDDEWVNKNLINYTSDKAKVDELLSSNGWEKGSDGIWAKDGEKLEIELLAPLQSWADTLNLTLGKSGEEFGIKFNITVLDFSVFLNHYYGKELAENERKYHMFALATTLGTVFDGYVNWHSDKIADPWGASSSTNTSRFRNDKNDELLLTMRSAKNDDVYQKAYREWVILMNEEMPVIPLYSNDYHDLYNKRLQEFKTSALWGWAEALTYCTVK